MKVLVVASFNKGYFAPFIIEQSQSLKEQGVDVVHFPIVGTGLKGYLKNLSSLKRTIESEKPDLVHAHFGLSGLLSVLQRRIPVVVTFHGSDLNEIKNRIMSQFVVWFAAESIFVSKRLSKLIVKRKKTIIPCGVDFQIFDLKSKEECRKQLGLQDKRIYILFSSAFSNPVKNFKLAHESVDNLKDLRPELIELKGYSREEVALLFNACDVAVMTSKTEGSPQFIKEAMASNCPTVSTDVGDVPDLFQGLEGYYVAPDDPIVFSDSIRKALKYSDDRQSLQGRSVVNDYNLNSIAGRLINVYENAIV